MLAKIAIPWHNRRSEGVWLVRRQGLEPRTRWLRAIPKACRPMLDMMPLCRLVHLRVPLAAFRRAHIDHTGWPGGSR